jgi:hypothetical protein
VFHVLRLGVSESPLLCSKWCVPGGTAAGRRPSLVVDLEVEVDEGLNRSLSFLSGPLCNCSGPDCNFSFGLGISVKPPRR